MDLLHVVIICVAYATITSAIIQETKSVASRDYIPDYIRYSFRKYDKGKTPLLSFTTQYRNLTIVATDDQGETKRAYSTLPGNTTHIYWIRKIPGGYKKVSTANTVNLYDNSQLIAIAENSNGAIEHLSTTSTRAEDSNTIKSILTPSRLEITDGIAAENATNTLRAGTSSNMNEERTQPPTTTTYPNDSCCQYTNLGNSTRKPGQKGVNLLLKNQLNDNEGSGPSNCTKHLENTTDSGTVMWGEVTSEENSIKPSRRSIDTTDIIKLNQSFCDNAVFEEFKLAVAEMEKQFYLTTFEMLSARSPEERRESGISFVLSGVWLHALLLLLSEETDAEARAQLDNITHFPRTLEEKQRAIKRFVAELPPSSESLKLAWSSRLVLGVGGVGGDGGGGGAVGVSDEFRARSRDALGLEVDAVPVDNATSLVETLNDMVQRDTGGALRGTFDEGDVSGGGGVRALLLSTLYFRSGWRAPVTLLNGTRDFRDARAPPHRQARMFRINDIVGYARVPEWDAEVVEIPYATPDLSLLAVVPRAASGLRAAARAATAEGVRALTRRLRVRRVALTLPLFTLRMTLLLPTKLEAMGAPALVTAAEESEGARGLRLSHGVQRLMFWADAGRNAYKDDGVEWDPRPDFSLLVDRPYFFMVKWKDFVLMMGNFVL